LRPFTGLENSGLKGGYSAGRPAMLITNDRFRGLRNSQRLA
jgi:hypothetical protein